ncbi:MAG TPA: hypothetical protein VMW89_03790 [Desulfatiglandales bacterium]|nr:hypothetical protein [Desulfatiglandales bacterium]
MIIDQLGWKPALKSKSNGRREVSEVSMGVIPFAGAFLLGVDVMVVAAAKRGAV